MINQITSNNGSYFKHEVLQKNLAFSTGAKTKFDIKTVANCVQRFNPPIKERIKLKTKKERKLAHKCAQNWLNSLLGSDVQSDLTVQMLCV